MTDPKKLQLEAALKEIADKFKNRPKQKVYFAQPWKSPSLPGGCVVDDDGIRHYTGSNPSYGIERYID